VQHRETVSAFSFVTIGFGTRAGVYSPAHDVAL
jgi:hypothetical protein